MLLLGMKTEVMRGRGCGCARGLCGALYDVVVAWGASEMFTRSRSACNVIEPHN